MKRVLLQQAYVLHRCAYRETSFLVEIFTVDYGRLTLIARGVRKTRSNMPGLLQPFVPLLISWAGKGELMTMTYVEAYGEPKRLGGECLFAGLYLNELLTALLQKWDAHTDLYRAYEKTISALQGKVLEQKILRSFEKYLLEELGYGLLPKSELSLHNMFSSEQYYRFIPEQGFVVSELDTRSQSKSNLFSGASLLAIAKEDWSHEESVQDAKRLIRFVLTPLLGTRPLYSRLLFKQPHEESHREE